MNNNWLLKDFCQRVAELKAAGMNEEEAKRVTKKTFEQAVDVVTGKRTLTECILEGID